MKQLDCNFVATSMPYSTHRENWSRTKAAPSLLLYYVGGNVRHRSRKSYKKKDTTIFMKYHYLFFVSMEYSTLPSAPSSRLRVTTILFMEESSSLSLSSPVLVWRSDISSRHDDLQNRTRIFPGKETSRHYRYSNSLILFPQQFHRRHRHRHRHCYHFHLPFHLYQYLKLSICPPDD